MNAYFAGTIEPLPESTATIFNIVEIVIFLSVAVSMGLIARNVYLEHKEYIRRKLRFLSPLFGRNGKIVLTVAGILLAVFIVMYALHSY